MISKRTIDDPCLGFNDNKHRFDWNESGYGGGEWAEVWCRGCDEMILVPVEVYKNTVPEMYDIWLEVLEPSKLPKNSKEKTNHSSYNDKS